MSNWHPVIGLEAHVQLQTKSKLFSCSPAGFTTIPNSQANELDFALPGTLPVLNREAVSMAILLGLALEAEVAAESEFARKHYFYPDLPKGYQISQFEHPVIKGGKVKVNGRNSKFEVSLVRAHLEEDAGKLMHDAISGSSVVDLNRAGVPLLEIVTEPVLRSATEASDYGRALRELVCWLGICDGNMQEGSLRFDVNVSLRANPDAALGTRCEIKNLNSFRFMEQAIEYEIVRQGNLLDKGQDIKQETLLFDKSTGTTRSMRSKEEAADYRYMPDPDLLPLRIDATWVQSCRDALPELPNDCRERLVQEQGISEYDATILTADKATVTYFETVVSECDNPKAAANWISGDLSAMCKANGKTIVEAPLDAKRLGGLIKRIMDGTISGKIAKELLERLWQDPGKEADDIIAAEGMRQISDAGELERIVAQLIAANPQQAEQYRAGKDKLLGFFVGQAMKATKGQAHPQQLNDIAQRLLQNS